MYFFDLRCSLRNRKKAELEFATQTCISHISLFPPAARLSCTAGLREWLENILQKLVSMWRATLSKRDGRGSKETVLFRVDTLLIKLHYVAKIYFREININRVIPLDTNPASKVSWLSRIKKLSSTGCIVSGGFYKSHHHDAMQGSGSIQLETSGCRWQGHHFLSGLYLQPCNLQESLTHHLGMILSNPKK